jgi:hypothetical protein
MASMRIAFDMDGTLADLSSAYAEMEERLFGAADEDAAHPAPEVREQEQQNAAAAGTEDGEAEPENRRRVMSVSREQVWQAIEATQDFWITLKPIEDGAVKRLYELTEQLNWEVFFITQRPATAGRTVQRQTHNWLVEQGFSTPSVIPLSGARGRAAAALKLDYLVDDTPQNCVDVLADSSARAILLVREDDAIAESSARRLGIGVAHSVHEVLDLLVQATSARDNPSLFEKLRKMVGWR